MAKIIEIQCSDSTTEQCVEQLLSQLREKSQGQTIQGGVIYCSIELEPSTFKSIFERSMPKVDYVAMTSCLGVFKGSAFQRDTPALSSLWFVGDDCSIGINQVQVSENASVYFAKQALEAANLQAAEANFAVICPTPGHEEQLLDTLYQELDKGTPIIGGSAADNDLSGLWRVWSSSKPASGTGAALLVGRWPGAIGTAYTGGYLPAGASGRVTKAEGRDLITIDHKPAAQVYNEWLGHSLQEALETGGSILQESTLSPLGVVRDRVGSMPTYVLAHPEMLNRSNGSISLFCEVYEGEELHLMTSSKPALLRRPKLVLSQAMRQARLSPSDLEASLMIYCAGCMLAIQDDVESMYANFERTVGATAKLCAFTFGEQGNIVKERWDHGNLMTSAIVFGKA